MREDIWDRVCVQGQSIKSVAAATNVDMRRVAAVVRLKEMEKKAVKEVCTDRSFLSQTIINSFPLGGDEITRNSISL